MEDQFDPIQKVELMMIRAEHQKQFQMSINYVKEKVGEGIEYKNSVVRIVVSDNGAYYELNDLPEDFSGAVGDNVERRFVTAGEALELLGKVVAATTLADGENTRHFTLMVLYTRRGLVDRKNCFIYDYHPASAGMFAKPPLQIGTFQPDVMPLFFKIKLDADYAKEIFGMERGLIFCMANAGDRNVLIRIAFDGEHITDLTNLPTTKTVH